MKKEKDTEKKEVCENFNLKKDGKEKNIKSCGIEETKKVEKGQIESENKILRNFLIGLGAFILIFIATFLIISSSQHFNYRGVKFDIIEDEGGLIFYKTSLPVKNEGKTADYNIYLRKDPRTSGEIDFNEDIELAKILVYNSTGFSCDGDGVIAVANFAQTMNIFGVKTVKDLNATCDPEGTYMFLNLKPGNRTSIEKTGPTCYEFSINNCEILDATEKFMVELIVKTNKIMK